MTSNGISIQKFLRERGFKKINMKNHIGDGVTKFNDMLLVFKQECPSIESCSISCIDPQGSNKKKYCRVQSSMLNKNIDKILLSQLIGKEGHDTYIITACRGPNIGMTRPEILTARQLSDNYASN